MKVLEVKFLDGRLISDVNRRAWAISAKDAATSVSIVVEIRSCRCLSMTGSIGESQRTPPTIIKASQWRDLPSMGDVVQESWGFGGDLRLV